MSLFNYDSNMSGIYRCIVLESDTSTYTSRVYIPGILNNNIPCPIYTDGTINESIYRKNINSYSIASWCVAGINVPFSYDSGSQAYVMFEAGNINYPVILDMANIMNGGSGFISGNSSTNFISSPNNRKIIKEKIVDAVFTAYYDAFSDPNATIDDIKRENGIDNYTYVNGVKKGITATGKIYDYTQNICAAPSEVSFGKGVQVLDTGTHLDNQIFVVEDRGGMINVNGDGSYHFDLLMKDKETANAWGEKRGKAIIGEIVESSSMVSGDGTKNKVVDIARNQIGKPYVWGGKGPNGFDCSGLVYYCYEQAGFTWPNGYLTTKRLVDFGRTLSNWEEVQAGDIMLCNYNDNYPQHVVIISDIQNKKYIHAPEPGKSVNESDWYLTNGSRVTFKSLI